jgi:sulfur-oxidizing protein SoxA
LLLWSVVSRATTPLADLYAFRQAYYKNFPQLSLEEYAQGVYAIDTIAHESWLAIEAFPPYIPAIDAGKLLFETPFKPGQSYANCFNNKGIAIAQNYPLWNEETNQVITLAMAINLCRIKYHQPELAYKKGELVQLLAYMTYTSRGEKINIKVPTDKPKAVAAYQQGKRYYYQRRGQLNFSCAQCHLHHAGKRLRAEVLSPALGHTSHWPSYRLKWGEIGTLHRRFIGCHQQIRAKLPVAQSVELRHLEYFLAFMSNEIPMNAPSTRK